MLVAYLFGSHIRGASTSQSDVDVAVLLSTIPKNLLEYFLHLVNEASKVIRGELDLIILNLAPPLLKHQVIRHGKVIYCRDEGARVEFEAGAEDEYLDLRRANGRYDERLLREISA